MANLLFAGVRILVEHSVYRHDDARRAKAALQSMLFLKGLLNGMHVTVRSSHTLYGRHYHSIGLNSEHQAGSHGFTVQQHSTTTTDTMFTAYMRTSMMEFMTEKI